MLFIYMSMLLTYPPGHEPITEALTKTDKDEIGRMIRSELEKSVKSELKKILEEELTLIENHAYLLVRIWKTHAQTFLCRKFEFCTCGNHTAHADY